MWSHVWLPVSNNTLAVVICKPETVTRKLRGLDDLLKYLNLQIRFWYNIVMSLFLEFLNMC